MREYQLLLAPCLSSSQIRLWALDLVNTSDKFVRNGKKDHSSRLYLRKYLGDLMTKFNITAKSGMDLLLND